MVDGQDVLTNKLVPGNSVFCWGGSAAMPTRLPLPSSDTQVSQVSAGRMQKSAVTKNGRLLIWEVSFNPEFELDLIYYNLTYFYIVIEAYTIE